MTAQNSERAGEDAVRLWDHCEMSEGGVTCSGIGSVRPFDTFDISANGQVIEVVVTGTTSNGPRWEAMDRNQYERLYSLDWPGDDPDDSGRQLQSDPSEGAE